MNIFWFGQDNIPHKINAKPETIKDGYNTINFLANYHKSKLDTYWLTDDNNKPLRVYMYIDGKTKLIKKSE